MKPPDLRYMTRAEITKLAYNFGKGMGKTYITRMIVEESLLAFIENREPKEIECKVMPIKI
jgi:hypothetical protein